MNPFNITTRNEKTTILSLLNCMKGNSVRVMESSRPYLYSKEKVIALFDSIMLGHPIHLVILSGGDVKIKSLPFIKNAPLNIDWQKVPYDNYAWVRDYVLDGVQRMQSLYTAYYACFGNDKLIYDLSMMGEGSRFSFIEKNKSSASEVRLDRVLAKFKKPLMSNWLFDAHNENVRKFSEMMKVSHLVHITRINVERARDNKTKDADGIRRYIEQYDGALGVLLNMLENPEGYSDFNQTCDRMKSFLKLIGNVK